MRICKVGDKAKISYQNRNQDDTNIEVLSGLKKAMLSLQDPTIPFLKN
jgi:hypothetical protein